MKKLAASADFQKLAALGKPLIFAWEEFGWESPEQPAYLTAPARYRALEHVEFVTLKEYLDKYGAGVKETVSLPMDAWNKSLTWGLGGDQVRILDRKVDGLLLAAELFDAVAAALGRPSQAEALEKAWRDLLASQSHDVGLCEYSRWQGDRMAPFDRLEDRHNFTWGAIGYNHLDAAEKQGQAVLDGAMEYLGGRARTLTDRPEDLAAVVFNPHAWPRTGLAWTGRIHPLPARSRDIVVRDRTGRVIPSQMAKDCRDSDGNVVVAELAFLAREVPPAGYDTYSLEFSSGAGSPAGTDLRVDESRLILENEFLRVRLDATTGGVASLAAKPSGAEMLDPAGGTFPHFRGRPNPTLPTRPEPPASYDSGASKAQIDWLARGPLWATVRAQHSWKYLKFETRVTLAAGSPLVEVTTRVLAQVPPRPDVVSSGHHGGLLVIVRPRLSGGQGPAGLSLRRRRDEERGLSCADLRRPRSARDRGLLVLHAGHSVLPARGVGPGLEPDHARVGIVLLQGIRLAGLRRIPSRPDAARGGHNERRPPARRGGLRQAPHVRPAEAAGR